MSVPTVIHVFTAEQQAAYAVRVERRAERAAKKKQAEEKSLLNKPFVKPVAAQSNSQSALTPPVTSKASTPHKFNPHASEFCPSQPTKSAGVTRASVKNTTRQRQKPEGLTTSHEVYKKPENAKASKTTPDKPRSGYDSAKRAAENLSLEESKEKGKGREKYQAKQKAAYDARCALRALKAEQEYADGSTDKSTPQATFDQQQNSFKDMNTLQAIVTQQQESNKDMSVLQAAVKEPRNASQSTSTLQTTIKQQQKSNKNMSTLQAAKKQPGIASQETKIIPAIPKIESATIADAVIGYLNDINTIHAATADFGRLQNAEPATKTVEEKVENTAAEADGADSFVDSDNYAESPGHDSDWDPVDDAISGVDIGTALNGEGPAKVDGKKKKGWF